MPVTPPLSMPTLVGDGLRVRPFSMADLAMVADASTDDYITSITSVPRPYTVEAGRAFVERQWGRARSGEGRSWAIARLEDDLGVGQIGLWPEDLSGGLGPVASIGYWVAPAARGQGVAGRALRLVTGFAHDDGIGSCELFIEPWNLASKGSARAAGYRPGGGALKILGGELMATERFTHTPEDRRVPS